MMNIKNYMKIPGMHFLKNDQENWSFLFSNNY